MSHDLAAIKLELAKRELGRRRLKHFIPYTFPSYRIREYNQLICDSVELVIEQKITRLMIFIQPRAGKSEIVSRRTPPYVLGKYPDKEIMITSYAASLASTFSREARDLISTERYQNLFGARSATEPEEQVSVSDKTKSVLYWRIANRRGGVLAAGVGGGITGQGADLAIIDDPIKDDVEAQSERTRETVYDWYFSALRTRLAEPTKSGIILCMTRWHEDDLAGKLLRTQYDVKELWHVLRLPALAETPEQTKDWQERNFVTPDRHLTPSRVKALLGE